MLNKPKFMIPSTNMQECVVDLNSDKIPFSCIVDGNEAIVSWQIQIYKLDDNTKVFDTGLVDISDKPFFPIDENNRNVVFEVNLLDHTVQVDATETQDTTKTYYYKGDGNTTDVSSSYPSISWKKDEVYPSFWYDGSQYYDKDDEIPDGVKADPQYEYFSNWSYIKSALYCFDLGNLINSDDPYYWTITVTGSSGLVVQSCEEVFYANSRVIGEIHYSKDNVNYSLFDSNPLQHKKYYFKSTHKQAEGIGLKRYGWRITDIDNNRVLLDTISKNQIYGTYDNMICQYDGFLSDCKYSIELYIETQNGDSHLTKPQYFSVSYPSTFLDGEFIPNILNSEPGIMIRWDDVTIAGGRIEGNATFMNDFPVIDSSSIKIKNNSKVIYDYNGNATLDISEDAYITLSTRIDSIDNTILFIAEGLDDDGNELIRKLSYIPDNGNGLLLYTLIKGDSVLTFEYNLKHVPFENVWYIIVMYPEKNNSISLKVTESIAEGGLYPEEYLYPGIDVYPHFGTWDKLKTIDSIAEEVN